MKHAHKRKCDTAKEHGNTRVTVVEEYCIQGYSPEESILLWTGIIIGVAHGVVGVHHVGVIGN